jgi:hypothetical protein
MASNVEMQDLKGKKKASSSAQTTSDDAPGVESIDSTTSTTEAFDNSISTWAYGSAALYVTLLRHCSAHINVWTLGCHLWRLHWCSFLDLYTSCQMKIQATYIRTGRCLLLSAYSRHTLASC